MTGDIVRLDDFRRHDAGPAKIATSNSEHHAHTLFVTLLDPLPNGWGEFVMLPSPLPKDWGEFWKATDFWWRPQTMATRPSPENWRWI
jgi:hypothetical protein